MCRSTCSWQFYTLYHSEHIKSSMKSIIPPSFPIWTHRKNSHAGSLSCRVGTQAPSPKILLYTWREGECFLVWLGMLMCEDCAGYNRALHRYGFQSQAPSYWTTITCISSSSVMILFTRTSKSGFTFQHVCKNRFCQVIRQDMICKQVEPSATHPATDRNNPIDISAGLWVNARICNRIQFNSANPGPHKECWNHQATQDHLAWRGWLFTLLSQVTRCAPLIEDEGWRITCTVISPIFESCLDLLQMSQILHNSMTETIKQDAKPWHQA